MPQWEINLHLWPHGEFPKSIDRGREDSGLVYRWFWTICKHHPKVDGYSTTSPCSGTSLKDSSEGTPPSRWTSSSEPGCSLSMEGEMARHMITYWITFSPATPVFTQYSHGQSGHGDRDGGYARAQQHGLPLTKAWLWPLLSAQPVNGRDQHHGTSSLGGSQLSGGRLITLDSFHHGRGNILFLLE